MCYVYFIQYLRHDGTVEHGRPEAEVGAHCQNHNEHSIGICYVGGLDNLNRPADTRTPAQHLALRGISGLLIDFVFGLHYLREENKNG